jgi:hypothetical protein
MARKFPHVVITCIDISLPSLTANQLPPNVIILRDDVNLSMEPDHNIYDLIHARNIQSGITNFAEKVEDLQRCLKPGGLIIFIENTYELWDSTEHCDLTTEVGSDLQTMTAQLHLARLIAGMSHLRGHSKNLPTNSVGKCKQEDER